MDPKLLITVSVMCGITSSGNVMRLQKRVAKDVPKLLDHAGQLLGKFRIGTSDALVLTEQRMAMQQNAQGPQQGEQYRLLPEKLEQVSSDVKKCVTDTLSKYRNANANNYPLPVRSSTDKIILHFNDVAWSLTGLQASIVLFPDEPFSWEFSPVDPRTLRCAILNHPVEEVLDGVLCRGYHIVGDGTEDLFRNDSAPAQTLVSIDHPLGQFTHKIPLSEAHAIKGFRTRVTCRVSGKRGEIAKVVGAIVFS